MSTLTQDSAPQTPSAPQVTGRDRYFDFLRALAIFRVVLYHLAGWSWLPLVFPSMGVMFALAGNLMARSLKRPAADVIRGRLRRLLPPVWLLGVVGVTGMIAQGWAPDPYWHPLWWWFHLAFWILPISEPPYADGLPGVQGLIGADWAVQLAGPLWYVRTYIWFVVLSPLLLRALRKLPVVTVLAPIALCGLLELGLSAPLPGERLASGLTDFTTFGACWILGMAHQEGILKRLPRYVVPSVAPAVALVGLWYALRHDYGPGHDLDDMPFAQSLWSVAVVALLLHFSPSWPEWPPRLRRWDGVIAFLNSRAVTIYLWHTTCIMIAATQWDRLWSVPFLEQHTPWLLESIWPVLVLTWLLVVACVVAFGWAEDLAARRRPRLWPKRADRGGAGGRS
ncbi:acyltransferase [Streptomyces phaeolivaceus]|uniref:Acyltransferase n=1 Tax=Streptomyces phaeolivaceus TaxID=2653200 RepID=A0A5P8K471_9ACTN|nr:acyltransferase [Streptomyces phaeolivaceus]QFQ97826.1 acyltransferase [Streptomyces phaeolivaceus]